MAIVRSGAAVSFINSTAATSHTATTITVPAGAIAVLSISLPLTSNQVNTIVNATGGASWTRATFAESGTTIHSEIWYWFNNTGASVSTTRTITLAASSKIATVTAVYTGVNSTNPVGGRDKNINNISVAASSTIRMMASSNNGTPSLLISAIGAPSSNTFTAVTGYGTILATASSSGGASTTNSTIAMIEGSAEYSGYYGDLPSTENRVVKVTASIYAGASIELQEANVAPPSYVRTDFTGYDNTNVPIYGDWWTLGTMTSTTENFTSINSANHLSVSTTVSGVEHVAVWGAPAAMNGGQVADVEVLARAKMSTTTGSLMTIYLRVIGYTTATQSNVELTINPTNMNGGSYLNGTWTAGNGGNVALPYTATVGTYYWMRARLVGSTLQGKTWQDGTAEPSGWQYTSTNMTQGQGVGGNVGIGTYSPSTVDFNFVSAAWNGGTAPGVVIPQNPPTVALNSPAQTVATYYLDGHIGVTDANAVWSTTAGAYDASNTTCGTTTTTGSVSTNNLYIQGTSSPTTLSGITQVRARVKTSPFNVTTSSVTNIYSASKASLLGAVTVSNFGGIGYSPYTVLTPPTGGWTAANIQSLESVTWTTNGDVSLYIVELEVTTNPAVSTTTPQLTFTGTDSSNDTIAYEVQVDSANTFDGQPGSPNTLADSYSESNKDATASLQFAAAGNDYVGQTFTSTINQTLTSAVFYINKVGTPTGNITASLFAHTGVYGTSGLPTGSALATSDAIVASSLSSTLALTTFTFSGANQYKMTSGNYVIVLNYALGDSTNYILVGRDSSSPTHSGNYVYHSSAGWSNLAYDVCFYVYTTPGVPLLDKFSSTDTGFIDITNNSDTTPFNSGDQIGYTTPALTAGNTYYWRVRGIDPTGSNTYGAWSSTQSFAVTSATTAPTVTASAPTSVSYTSATANATVTNDNGATITDRGIVWSTSPAPTVANNKISVTGTTGSYSASLSGLSLNTTYYYRGYATNSVGTSYSSDVSFTTLTYNPPTVTTDATLTSNKAVYAVLGGNITALGDSTPTVRGICYVAGAGTPTTANSVVQDTGSFATGAFTKTLTGLTGNTQYTARAFATNSYGTSYGAPTTFTTKIAISSVEQLQAINNNISPYGTYGVIRGDYVLTRDLDFNLDASYDNPANKSTYTTGAGFAPIGRGAAFSAPWFGGTFDGDGHTLSNLMINATTSGVSNAGLFGVTDESTIENMGMINPQINANATDSGFVQVGAIVMGYDTQGQNILRKCFVKGGKVVGGVGSGNNGTGAMVGIAHQYNTGNLDIIDCYAEGTQVIRNGSATGNAHPGVGGLVGSFTYISGAGTTHLNITNSYAACSVTGTADVGGLLGVQEASVNNNGTSSYWDTAVSGQTVSAAGTGKTTAQMKTMSTFSGWSINTKALQTTETWWINDGSDYPRLSYQAKGPASYTKAHTTSANKKAAGTLSHSTSSVKRVASVISHTTSANRKKQVILSHTTDSVKRKANTVSHTTATVKRIQVTKTHTTDSVKRIGGITKTYTTDSLKRKQTVLVHTTDALKRKQNLVSHTTSSNRKVSGVIKTHATSSNLKISGFTRLHSTDTFKRKQTTLSHTTDANKKVSGLIRSHTTDASKKKQLTVSHTTDANIQLGKQTFTRSFTTDSIKRVSGLVRTHTTDSVKRKATTVIHTTSANLKLANLAKTHTSDALKRKSGTKSHSTDSNKRKALSVSHTTDSNRKLSGFTRLHTTDSLKRKQFTASHTTSANRKRSGLTVTHTTSTNKRISGLIRTHATDANKRIQTTVSHSASGVIRKQFTRFHSTDSLKRRQLSLSHTIDSLKRISGLVRTHTTDALKRRQVIVAHTTNANKKLSGLTVSHTTSSYIAPPTYLASTYYFNASDAAPTDPGNSWTSPETNAFDGLTTTFTTGGNVGSVSSNYLMGEGTNSPTTGTAISQVRVRAYGRGTNDQVGMWSTWTVLTAPAAGWLWQTVNDLEVKAFISNFGDGVKGGTTLAAVVYTNNLAENLGQLFAGTSTNQFQGYDLARIELEVTYHNASQGIITHSTSANKKASTSVSHTTDANKKASSTRSHTTNSLLRKQLTKTHSTDANKRVTGLLRSHNTSSVIRKQGTKTHTTDTIKRTTTAKTHSTDSLKRKQLVRTHTTDTLLRKQSVKTHTTDVFKRKSAIATHTTDSNRRISTIVTHSTDTFIDTGKRYWVGGTAAWDATAGNKWAAVSGGTGGFSVPTIANDVFFDANSGTGTVTVQTAVATPGNLDFTGFTGTFVQQSNINMGSSTKGNLTLGAGMTYTWVSGQIKLSSTMAGNTYVNTNGVAIGNIAFNGAGANFVLLNSLVSVGSVAFSGGTVDFNGYNLTAYNLSNGNTSTRTVNLRAGTLTLTGTGSISDVPGGSLTYSWTTGAKFVLSNTSTSAKTFAANGQALPPIEVLGAPSDGTVTFSGTFTTDKFKFYPDANVVFTSGTTFTAITLDWNGTSTHPITISSTTAGTPAVISVASGIVSADYLALKDSTATGGATFYAGNHSIDNGGNTGWLFSSIKNTYTVTQSTDTFKRRALVLTHTTGALIRKSNTRSHTADANKKKSGLVVSHTTDSNKKRSGITIAHTTSSNKKTAGLSLSHTTNALKRTQSTKSHLTDALKRVQTSKTHTTSSVIRKSSIRTHLTDTLLRKQQLKSHTTDANKKKVGNLVSHTTDLVKRSQALKSHTTDALKRIQHTLTHTTGSFLRRQIVRSHTSDSLLRAQKTRSHTTDSNKKKSGSLLAHSTDANKKKNNLLVHTTSALKRQQFTKIHSTDSYKRLQVVLVHTTNALVRKAFSITHKTDTYMRGANQRNHATDANKKKSGNTVVHTTSSNKRIASLTRTHFTSAVKRVARTLTYTTDSNKKKTALIRSHTTDTILRVSGRVRLHTTDANKRIAGKSVTHTTNTLKRKQATLAHTTDALRKKAGLLKSHTTSSILRKSIQLFHTTNVVLRKVSTRSHATDSNKKSAGSLSHSTDSYTRNSPLLVHSTDTLIRRSGISLKHSTNSFLRKAIALTHFTSANKRKANILVQSTSAALRKTNVISHNTDAELKHSFNVTHSTDANLRYIVTLSHSADANKKQGNVLSHSTDASIFDTTGVAHLTDAHLYTLRGTKQVLINGQWQHAAIYYLNSDVWVESKIYYKDADNNWIEVQQ